MYNHVHCINAVKNTLICMHMLLALNIFAFFIHTRSYRAIHCIDRNKHNIYLKLFKLFQLGVHVKIFFFALIIVQLNRYYSLPICTCVRLWTFQFPGQMRHIVWKIYRHNSASIMHIFLLMYKLAYVISFIPS
jgi:hypothetical protein